MILLLTVALFFSCSNDKIKNLPTEKSNEVTISNCDIKLSFEKKPIRIICIGQHTTELLIAMGLENKIIGWAFPDSYPTPKVDIISEQYPAREVFLLNHPDFVYSGYKGAFTQEQLGTREYLKSIGINSYIPVGRCVEKDRPAVIEDLYADILNIGKIFDLNKKSKQFVDSLKNEFKDLKSNLSGNKDITNVMVFGGGYSSGALLVDGGYALSSDLIHRAGGMNIFSDIQKQNVEINVEEIIQRNPEVIVVKSSLTDPNAKRSLEYLFGNKSLRNITAIKDSSIVILPFTSMLPGVRNLEAIKSMAAVFHPSTH